MSSAIRNPILEVDAQTEQRLVQNRRDLHANPELSGNEVETAHYLAERLDALTVDALRTDVGGTGVVADIKGSKAGKTVLVRADMDGLPIEEAGDLPYRSTRKGVMHACGHDVHMAIALNLADAFARNRDAFSGMVRFAFQPAEEKAGGAGPMIDAGVLDGVDRVIGLHVWSELPLGQVSVRRDVVMASADMFTLTVRGKAGHGAQPHLTVDAVAIAAQIVSALQTLVSRETAPASRVVITIGSIHAGTAANIVAGEAILQGTLRTFDKALRATLLTRIAELADGIARAMRGRCEFRLDSQTPPTVNNPSIADQVGRAASAVLGEDAVVSFEPLMVGEDFAYFLEARPGCFFLLGGAPDGSKVVHHTAQFRIDERCLNIGYRVMGAAVLRLLEPD
jgi:amidohydrolase